MSQTSPPNPRNTSKLLALIATLLVVATLYVARAVFIPMALAIVLCFLLSPLVNRVQRWGLKRVPAVLVVTVLSFALISAVCYVVAIEAISLAETLPQYKGNIREKVKAMTSPGIFSHAKEQIREATEEVIEATTQPEQATSAPTGAQKAPALSPSPAPIDVRIAEPAINPLELLMATVSPLLGPMGTAGIVIVFVIFMLIQQEDLRDRIIGLIGPSQVNITTQAIDDAAQRVSRYFLMQFVVNVTHGIAAGVGLYFLGVANPVLWGALCMLLRYIPYIGPWLGASMPILLSLAASDGWTQPLMVIAFFVVLELISNNVMEPLFYGKGTGVSPVAVIVAAVFWTWLWGVPGLMLAMPMTVCVVVIGRYFPQMEWLSRLLGDEPGLPLPARVYQRLLALDHEEIFALAKEYLKSNKLIDWYDQVIVPALILAERDRHEGALDEQRATSVYTTVRSMIEELDEWKDTEASGTTDAVKVGAGEPAPAESDEQTVSAAIARKDELASRPLVLIVSARDEADELAGLMLAQLMQREGQRCESLAEGGLTTETSQRALELNPAAICVSAMPPMAVTHARYMCKRLHERLPAARLVVGVWNASDLAHAAERVRSTGGETVVATFAQAIAALRM